MRSCGLKEEVCGMNAVDKESEFTQPQDGLPCGGLSRSLGQACLEKHLAPDIQEVSRLSREAMK